MPTKLSYEEVKDFIEECGCKLLSKEYENSTTRLKVQCACGEVFDTNFKIFKKGQRQCKQCLNAITYRKVEKFIEECGCKLLSAKYVNARTKLKIQCACGEVFERSFNNFQGKKTYCCSTCGYKKLKNDYEEVAKFIEDKGCKLLSEEYINAGTKLKIQCACGEVFEVCFNHFKSDGQQQCPKCGIKKITGENHPKYNPNLTEEEREKLRSYPQYRQFVKQVYENDNYTCRCCGDNKNGIESHHLNGYKWDKTNKVNPINGITLCEECHKEFHKLYGRRNNTIEQFREFIYDKYLKTDDFKYLDLVKELDFRKLALEKDILNY